MLLILFLNVEVDSVHLKKRRKLFTDVVHFTQKLLEKFD